MGRGTIGKISISPSTIKVAACPFALNCKVNGVPPDGRDSSLAQFGKAMHSINHSINIFKGRIDDNALDRIISENACQNVEFMRFLALEYMRYFPVKKVIASEMKMALDSNLRPCAWDDATYRGIVDALTVDKLLSGGFETTQLTIWDHKAGWAMYNPVTMQTMFYAWLVYRTFNYKFDSIKLAMHFPRYREMRIGDKTFFPSNMPNIERSMLAIAQQVWNTPVDGPAIPGAQCANCNWLSRCPVPDEYISEIQTEEDAKTIAGMVRVMDVQSKELKGKLKRWVKRNGPVVLRDHKWTWGPVESTSFSADAEELLTLSKEWKGLRAYLKVDEAKSLLGHGSGLTIDSTTKLSNKGHEMTTEEETYETTKAHY